MNPIGGKFIVAVERLGRALRLAKQRVATEHRLSVLQVDLIERLTGGGAVRVGALADELDVTQPTVSDAIGALVAKGLVERSPDPTDGRATVVDLSAAGAKVGASIAQQLSPLLGNRSGTEAANEAVALRVILEEIRRLQLGGVISVNRSCLSCRHYQEPSASRTAQCLLLNESLADADLRVDCPEHEALAEAS